MYKHKSSLIFQLFLPLFRFSTPRAPIYQILNTKSLECLQVLLKTIRENSFIISDKRSPLKTQVLKIFKITRFWVCESSESLNLSSLAELKKIKLYQLLLKSGWLKYKTRMAVIFKLKLVIFISPYWKINKEISGRLSRLTRWGT